MRQKTIDVVGSYDGCRASWIPLACNCCMVSWWIARCAIEQSGHFPGVMPCHKSRWWDYRLKPLNYQFIWRVDNG